MDHPEESQEDLMADPTDVLTITMEDPTEDLTDPKEEDQTDPKEEDQTDLKEEDQTDLKEEDQTDLKEEDQIDPKVDPIVQANPKTVLESQMDALEDPRIVLENKEAQGAEGKTAI